MTLLEMHVVLSLLLLSTVTYCTVQRKDTRLGVLGTLFAYIVDYMYPVHMRVPYCPSKCH